jgi:hypothetical protein
MVRHERARDDAAADEEDVGVRDVVERRLGRDREEARVVRDRTRLGGDERHSTFGSPDRPGRGPSRRAT